MLLARIRVTTGAQRGMVTYAEVGRSADGAIDYAPVRNPFASDSAGQTVSGVVPATEADLLAPCQPKLVLGMAHNTGYSDRLIPPQAFHKSPHSVIGPGQEIELQSDQLRVEGEAELAVVIGRSAKNLTRESALTAVYGYTCANDVTDRIAQASDSLWTEAKSRDTFTPLGPWIRTDLDPTDVPVKLSDAAHEGTAASTKGLARSVAELLVYLSSVMTLQPGDVILSGAPGRSLTLTPGDVSTVWVSGIGELTNPVTERRNCGVEAETSAAPPPAAPAAVAASKSPLR